MVSPCPFVPIPDQEIVDVFQARLSVALDRLPFPSDSRACTSGLLAVIREVNLRFLPQMAVPILKLACNVWTFGPVEGSSGRRCPFCGDPLAGGLSHLLPCPAFFGLVAAVLPGCPWSEPPPVRLLELCGVGADPSRLAVVGLVLDGMWAALVAHSRSPLNAQNTFTARLAAMGRLSPALARALDAVRFSPAG